MGFGDRLASWLTGRARRGGERTCVACRDWPPVVFVRAGEGRPLAARCPACGWEREVIEVIDRRGSTRDRGGPA